MARLFYASVCLGIVLTIIAAAVYPLPRHPRFPSNTTVIPDGGRQEAFTVEWPQDRLPMSGPEASQTLADAGGASVLLENGRVAASAEIFRLRDLAGKVIGLASRSTSLRASPGGMPVQGSDWALLVPSRGTLFLTQTNSRDVAPHARAQGPGFVTAADVPGFWSPGERSYRITAGPAPENAGQVVGGTEEFAGLVGTYGETWDLVEVAADGSTRGRVTLSTRLQASH